MPNGQTVNVNPTGPTSFTYQGGPLSFDFGTRNLGTIQRSLPAFNAGTIDAGAARSAGGVVFGGPSGVTEQDLALNSSPYRALDFLKEGESLRQVSPCGHVWIIAGVLALLYFTSKSKR